MKNKFRLPSSENLEMDGDGSKKGYLQVKKTTGILILIAVIGSLALVGFVSRNVGVSCESIKKEENNVDDQAPESLTKPKIDVRLPRALTPLSYDLKFIPFITPDNFTFRGEAQIKLKAEMDTKNITLHSLELNITDSDITIYKLEDGEKNNEVPKTSLTFIKEKEFLVIAMEETLKENEKYLLIIKFVGKLDDNMRGFYKSSYRVGSETRWIASTQFQPTDARRAFPCFDEPGVKATFKIAIARPKNMISLSNMPRESSILEGTNYEQIDGYTWDIYEKSVPMATYLVAFVVCDFLNKTNGNFAVWAQSGAIEQTDYALDIGPKVLKHFEDFFDIKFPIPKMDMVAIPDFSMGAMENWGLITYRETAMLFEKGVSSAISKKWIANVIAHELSHQWFGNLVTPKWWTDLWLNEGFATYVAYLGVDLVEPTWNYNNDFIITEIQTAFSLDALSSSHPISIEVGHPSEISEIFDAISYKKGASIIRMMEHFLTRNVFKKGLTNYLKDFSYKSAEQNDLWEELTKAAHESKMLNETSSVKEIMDSWTLQTGFPVVKVTRDYAAGEIRFEQEKYYVIPKKDRMEDTLWWIPITYTSKAEKNFDDTKPKLWLNGKAYQAYDSIDRSQWLLVNLQQTGYYRVNYDIDNWKLISDHLNDPTIYKEIPISNRAQLIDDVMSLARSGYLDYSVALDLTRYVVHENDTIPWKSFLSKMSYLHSMMRREKDYGDFKTYFLQQILPIYLKIEIVDSATEDFLSVYAMTDFVQNACSLGEKSCIEKAKNFFSMWMNEADPDATNPIPPNFKGVIYCNAIKHGSDTEWNFLYERFLKANVPTEREIILSALGCSREVWILKSLLEKSLSEEHGIRKQDIVRVYNVVSSNIIGEPIAFNFVRDNWKRIMEYARLPNLWKGILRAIASDINTQRGLDEFKEIIKTNDIPDSRDIHQMYENIEANIDWMTRNYDVIVEWLKTNGAKV